MANKNKPRIKYLPDHGKYKLYGEIAGRRLSLEDEPWNFNTKTEATQALSALKASGSDVERRELFNKLM